MKCFSRRSFLIAILAASFGARASDGPRIVALDWGWAATALALGATPLGVAEQRLYRAWVGEPALPEEVVDIGLRTAPSFETIAALKPDLILTNAMHIALAPQLERIAPTLVNPTFAQNRSPLANAKAAMLQLSERLRRQEQATALIADSNRSVRQAREFLQAWQGREFLPLSVVDRRHLTIHGNGSLFVDTLLALGLRGLWPGPTSLWGHRIVAIADLADLPPGDLLLIDPLTSDAEAVLDPESLLMRLCMAAGRTVYRLPPAWGFGDLTAAVRFTRLLTVALGPEPPA